MAAKVLWSDALKAQVTTKGIKLHLGNAELAGLSLLRAAIKALPVNRRRKVISLSQVEWFGSGIKSETSRLIGEPIKLGYVRLKEFGLG